MKGHLKQKEQSRRMIEESLFQLMEEKEYSQITVSEIVKRADVSRRTFYRLYGEKDEVLRGFLRKLSQEYSSRAPKLKGYHIRRIAREYFCFWYQYREFLLLLHRRQMDEMLYCEISRASIEVVRKRMGDAGQKEPDGMEHFASYSAGGFILLLQRWIMMGMEEMPEQYAKNVSDALLKFINGNFSVDSHGTSGNII